jgi:hypothetical protein
VQRGLDLRTRLAYAHRFATAQQQLALTRRAKQVLQEVFSGWQVEMVPLGREILLGWTCNAPARCCSTIVARQWQWHWMLPGPYEHCGEQVVHGNAGGGNVHCITCQQPAVVAKSS